MLRYFSSLASFIWAMVLPEVLAIARAVNQCPSEVVIIGIQPREVSLGMELSAEVAQVIPRAGGEYVYLTEAYGPTWGFMTGWVSFFAGFSAPIAAAALAVEPVPAHGRGHSIVLTLPPLATVFYEWTA